MKFKILPQAFVGLAFFCATLHLGVHAHAQTVRVTVENTASAGGTWLTPVFIGFDSNTFDLFNTGEAASTELEALAELGSTGGLINQFNASAGSTFAGTFGVQTGDPMNPLRPLFAGDSVTQDIFIGDATHLTFATMLLPTSDFFLGSGTSIAITDLANGMEFTNIYNAGTEVDSFLTSPTPGPFSFLNGMPEAGAAENGAISLVGNSATTSSADLFSGFLGQPTDAFAPPLSGLRITVSAVPEPSSLAVMGLFSVGGLIARRRRKPITSSTSDC